MTLLPLQYTDMADEQVFDAIRRAKTSLGSTLTILAHHYQREEVIQFADARGDSLGLSQLAAKAKSRYIVFCGVHFMAETAAILADLDQIVIQPALEASCPMAEMANARQAQEAWDGLTALWGDDLIPITYQNSIAELKAFVGKHGGAVCTSSNAEQTLRWAYANKNHCLFMPDQYLGTNTALAMGMPREQIGLWVRRNPDPTALANCRLVAWDGYCSVHRQFTLEDVARARQEYPGALVVVHPECRVEVVDASDASGSTTSIIDYVNNAPAGSTIVVGTEWNLVDRLAREHHDRLVVPLRRSACRTMGMTTARHLLFVLDGLLADDPRNVITVDPETTAWARLALERMLRFG